MTNNSLVKLTLPQLKRVVAIREKIEKLARELNHVTGSQSSSASGGKKGRLSAAVRAKMSAAAKVRWAAIRARKAKGTKRSA